MAAEQAIPSNVTHELLPFEKQFRDALEQLPRDAHVAITATDSGKNINGVDSTVDRAVYARQQGYEHVVPHIAGRSLRDANHLDSLLDQLGSVGVSELFVVGGDSPYVPSAEISDGLDVISGVVDYNDRKGHPFRTIGVPGYPRGHYAIGRDALWSDLHQKQTMLIAAEIDGYIETQFDFDGQTIINWLRDHELYGIQLPVKIGVFGAVGVRKGVQAVKLMKSPAKAFRFLEHTGQSASDLAFMDQHVPRSIEMVETVVDAALEDPNLGVYGFTINTLNDIENTRQRMGAVYDAAQMLDVPFAD